MAGRLRRRLPGSDHRRKLDHRRGAVVTRDIPPTPSRWVTRPRHGTWTPPRAPSKRRASSHRTHGRARMSILPIPSRGACPTPGCGADHIRPFDLELRDLVADMIETMRLAWPRRPQVGVGAGLRVEVRRCRLIRLPPRRPPARRGPRAASTRPEWGRVSVRHSSGMMRAREQSCPPPRCHPRIRGLPVRPGYGCPLRRALGAVLRAGRRGRQRLR